MSVRDPDRWQQAQTVFLQAAGVANNERQAFLDRACDDHELRRAVDRLLAADERSASFIEHAIADGASLLDHADEPAEIGQTVGRYRLIRQIGRGGMGVVYLAERADQAFDKQVALKLMAPGLADADRQRRFHAERQILADLEHPSIARLLDGGTTDDDRPYLVLEYIEGEPIDRHCQGHALGLRDRLKLFLTVCEAVDHAHQNLIVHRDLKPENILVRDDGTVKLLDFGIAKLLAAESSSVGATVTAAGLMTPQYASPEQMRGEPVATTSDVYALGLVLYRLLTDSPPYDLAGTAPAELARLVCDVDPPPPSVAAATEREMASVSGSEPAAGNATRPVAASRLAGDLDAIVMKALRKERQARYSSVALFAADVERYLTARPVSARKGTAAYRLRKFVGRHRAGLAALVAGVLLAITFTVRVVIERNRAEQAVALLADLIAFSEPAGETRRSQTAEQQRFDARTDALIESLDGRARLQGNLLAAIGRLFHVLGLDGAARPRLEQALALRRSFGDDPDLADSLDRLGELLREAGEFEQAESLLTEALAMRHRLGGEDDLDTAESLDNLGHVIAASRGAPAEVEALYRQALDVRLRLAGADDLRVAESRNNLGIALQDLGRLAEAEDELNQARTIYRRQLGDDDPDIAMIEANLGNLLVQLGRPAEAEPYLRSALTIDLRHFGERHASVAQDRDSLAWALKQQADYEAAEREYRAALAVRQELWGDDHPATVTSVNNLASLLLDAGRFEEAVPLFRSALTSFRAIYQPRDHLSVAQVAINLAATLDEIGTSPEALALLREALGIRHRLVGDSSLAVADAKNRLAAALVSRDAYEEAETLLRQALAVHRADESADPRQLAFSLHHLGRLLAETARAQAATPLLREALTMRTDILGSDHPSTTETREQLSACLVQHESSENT